MSSSPRVLLLGRHFWPHGSLDNANHLIQLATDFKRQGIGVEVLTPRYAASWTQEFCFREIPVHRPAIAPRSDWSMGRYTRHLTKWLRENSHRYDIVLVDGAREESVAAMDARRSTQRAVIVRIGSEWNQSDLDWWDSSRSGQRCGHAAASADAIVGHGVGIHRGLVSRSIPDQRIHRIEIGFASATQLGHSGRIEARRALAAVNRDLHAPADEPIVFCVAPMEPTLDPLAKQLSSQRVNAMVDSARHLVARYPLLHLWFIGDGSQRDLIYDTLRGDGVRASIAMPGSFGNMEDVFAAADVFVQIDQTGLTHFLPTAVATHLPIVAADLPEVREILRGDATPALNVANRVPTERVPADRAPADRGDNLTTTGASELVAWFDPSTPKTFRKAMRRVLDDLTAANAKAETLHRQLIRSRSRSDVVDQYLNLFDTLIAKRRSSNQGPSIGAVS